MANSLFGAFKPHEYGLVILPMVVIKRFHDCLLPTHSAVLEKLESIKHLAVKDSFLRKASGYQFYNTSPFTFETLKDDPLIELTTIGLKGSPTNILTSFTPPQKGAGMMLEGADKETCETLANLLAKKHII